MNLDYESLRLLSWALLILTVIAYIVFDGIIIGVCLLRPLIAKDDEQQQYLNSMLKPHSLPQQAWLAVILCLLFAAWPMLYAVITFSLSALLIFAFLAWLPRSMLLYFHDNLSSTWRENSDKALWLSGLLPALSIGLVAGNLLKGIPFHLDNAMQIFFLGDLWGLLNPFALWVSAVSVALLACHGALFLQLNSNGCLYQNSKSIGLKAGSAFLLLFIVAGLWVTRLEGYHISSEILTNAAANPLAKFVKRGDGLWLDNYEHEPTLWIIPILTLLSAGLSLFLSHRERNYWAFIASTVTVTLTVLTTAISMFPFLLPSNRSLNTSLTLWDASASQETLMLLLPIYLVALPLMIVINRLCFRYNILNIQFLTEGK